MHPAVGLLDELELVHDVLERTAEELGQDHLAVACDVSSSDSVKSAVGQVVEGMDVVDKIAAVETGNRGGHQDVPVDAVTITEVTIDD